MSKSTITTIIVAAVVLLGGITIFALSGSSDDKNSKDDHSSSMGADTESIITTKSDENAEAQQTNTVAIEDFSYQPQKIQIKKGTTVTWTNKDEARHDITPDSPSDDFKASELLKQGESYSFTFDKVGTYTYFCSPHPYMKGTVEVIE